MLFSLWSQTKTQSKWLQTGHYLWTFCLRKSRHRVTEFAHVESCSRLEVVFFNSLILRSLLWFFDIHPGLQVKTSHWKSLPWILAGLALPDEEAARSIARRCCTMYDNSEDLSPSAVYGRKHPLSRRFLDYSFGDGQSLRHDLDEFVRGVSRRDLDRFCAWCGALRLMKTTEQPTEGLHRSLRQIMSRAPNASPAYLSTESRLPMFGRAFNSPETLARLAQKNEDLCSHKDLTKAIAKLIGGPGCIPAEGRKISHSDLVHLLYHCHFKYDRGKQTALVLPTSTAQKLRENKHLTLNGCDMDVFELFLVCIFDWAIGLLNSYSPATVWNGLFSNWLWLGLFRWIWTVLPAHTHSPQAELGFGAAQCHAYNGTPFVGSFSKKFGSRRFLQLTPRVHSRDGWKWSQSVSTTSPSKLTTTNGNLLMTNHFNILCDIWRTCIPSVMMNDDSLSFVYRLKIIVPCHSASDILGEWWWVTTEHILLLHCCILLLSTPFRWCWRILHV